MFSVCRICLASNTRLQSLKNNLLRSFYKKLTNAKFNSEDARPRALCSFCYQRLLRCHTFSQMAVRSEKIFNHVYDMGLEVTHEYITEVNLNMKQHLSVATLPFITIDVNATHVGPELTIKDEPQPADIDIKEEVTTEPDTLLEVKPFPKDCKQNQITFKDNITDRVNDTEELLSNIHTDRSKPDDSYFTIKDERLSSVHDIDIKEEITIELNERVEPFPEHSTKSLYTFQDDNSDQERDVEDFHHKIQIEETKQDHSKIPVSCNKIFYRKSKLISHIRNSYSHLKGNKYSSTKKHTETTSMIGDKINHNQKKNLTCHVCHKTFSNKSGLNLHMRIHTGEKPFACNVCDKQFVQKHHLVFHMSSHTGERLFACNVCDKRFYQKSALVSHIRTHTGEKPFACHVCDKHFNHKCTLVTHSRTHTGEKPFACHVCDKHFNHKSTLVAHSRTHTGEKPFACHVCVKQFNRKHHLVQHMKTHAP